MIPESSGEPGRVPGNRRSEPLSEQARLDFLVECVNGFISRDPFPHSGVKLRAFLNIGSATLWFEARAGMVTLSSRRIHEPLEVLFERFGREGARYLVERWQERAFDLREALDKLND